MSYEPFHDPFDRLHDENYWDRIDDYDLYGTSPTWDDYDYLDKGIGNIWDEWDYFDDPNYYGEFFDDPEIEYDYNNPFDHYDIDPKPLTSKMRTQGDDSRLYYDPLRNWRNSRAHFGKRITLRTHRTGYRKRIVGFRKEVKR